MARSDSAQILIAIRGGVQAARQAQAVAGEMDHLGKQTREAGEDAAESAGGFALLSAELDRTKRKMDLMRVSSEGMGTAATLLTLHYLPALASTLAHVGSSALIVTGAFSAGAVALVGILGGMAKAIEARYKNTVNIVGSAANKLQGIIGRLKQQALISTAPGADAALGGIAAGLAPLRGVLKTLTPQITAIGRAMGSVFKSLGKQIATLGPEFRKMLGEAPAAVKALGTFAGSALKLFARLATAGLPLVVKALRLAAKLMDSLTRTLTNKKINNSVSTLVSFGKTLGKVFAVVYTGSQKFVKQLLTALKPAAPFLQNVIAPLLLGVWKGIKGLLPGIKLLAEGLGALGKLAAPLKGVFQAIGEVIGVVFGGEILKGIGALTKIIPYVGKAGDVFSLLGRTVDGIGGLVSRVLGRLADALLGPVERALGSFGRTLQVTGAFGNRLIGALGKVVSFLAGTFPKVAKLLIKPFSDSFVWIIGQAGKLAGSVISKFSSIIDWIKGAPSKIASAASGMFDGITAAMKNALNSLIDLWDKLHFTIGGWHIHGPLGIGVTLPHVTVGLPHIPHLATGTPYFQGGTALVGENGPELVNMPRGSEVIPNDRTESMLANTGRGRDIYLNVMLDRKVLARAVRHQDDEDFGNGAAWNLAG